MRSRLTDPKAIIDAIEISQDDNFITVYINSNSPGLPGSYQKNFIEEFSDLLEDPNLHDPNRFHIGDHPRGSNWRIWENKYACHFHFIGDKNKILKALLDRADLSDNLRGKINETICN